MEEQDGGFGWGKQEQGPFGEELPPPVPVPPPLPPPLPPEMAPPVIYATPGPPRRPSSTSRSVNLGLMSMVLGGLGLVTSFFFVGGVIGLAGFVLGMRHALSPSGGRLWGVAGACLSAMAIVISAWLASSLLSMFDRLDMASSMGEFMGRGGFNDWVGVQAPDFEAVALDGKTVRLSDYRGRRVVIQVFRDWDLGAVDGAEHLKRVAKEHSETAVFGMSSEREEELRKLNSLAAFPFPIVCSRDMDEPYRRFASGEAFLFLDTKGIIQRVMFGRQEYAKFAEAALSPDYEGTPHPVRAGRLSNATDAARVYSMEKVWSRPAEEVKDIVAGDWNGDGQDEILVLGAYKVECIDAGGVTVAEWTPPLMTREIEFGKCGGERRIMARTRDAVYLYTTDGRHLWMHSSGDTVRDCCFVDADGDGCDDVLAGIGDMQDRLVLLGSDGKERWGVSDSMLSSFRSQAGLNAGNGHVYLLTTLMAGKVGSYTATGRKDDSFGPGFAGASGVAVAEMNEGGEVQILYWTNDGFVLAMNGGGTSLWRCSARSEEDETKTRRLAAGDWDGDGVKEWAVPGSQEMLIVSASGKIVCHTGIYDTVPALLNRPGMPGLFVAGSDAEISAYAPAGT